jgi:hypothetical protein
VDVSGAVLLYTLAGLMVTFAGFSTLLLVIRQAAGSRLSVLDRYLAKTVLTNSLVLTAAALLPPLLALYGIAEAAIWKIAAVCFAAVMLALLLSFPHRRRKAVGKGPPPMVLAIFVLLGSAVIVAMLVSILAGCQHPAAAYITALIVNFFALGYGFVTAMDVILQQPADG